MYKVSFTSTSVIRVFRLLGIRIAIRILVMSSANGYILLMERDSNQTPYFQCPISVPRMSRSSKYTEQWNTNVPETMGPLKNSGRLKDDMQQVPH
jgi:hypothetical protein